MPALVDEPDQLVAANSRLARLTVIAGAVGGAIGAAVARRHRVPGGHARPGLRGVHRGGDRHAARCPRSPPTTCPSPSVEYEELHAPTIVATAWAFTVVRAAVGFFVFGLAFALRRESEPAWMYGAAVAAYGVGTFAGSAVAPLLRRRYGEDRLTAGALVALAVVAGFGALGASRALVLLVSVVLGAAAAVGRQGFDALVQTRAPGRVARPVVRPLRDPLPARLGGRRDRRRRRRHPDALQPRRRRRGAGPGRPWLYVRTLREAHEAHVEDPVRPGRDRPPPHRPRHRVAPPAPRSARRHRARRRRRPRPRPRDGDGRARRSSASTRCASAALSTWPLDTREVYWAIERAVALVEQLERTAAGEPAAAPAVRRPRRLRPRRSGSTDDDVTVHCDERERDRQHPLRPVDVGPVDLDGDVDRIALRRQRSDGDQHAVVAHRAPRPRRCSTTSDAGVGEPHVGLLVELADDLGLDDAAMLLLAHADDEDDAAARRGRPADGSSASTSRIAAT